ncbi:ComEC/Rec2 family competence protein [Candidatus Dojkabacteria bacterium]|uniref:ComEC/Rec2 family competence protein n=1 Tax=Candidatus Dojkabacteria bacterium TaxID=2099670 RepID=A0A955RLH7_9BACT|nr:ComEC/Rec2 family competence protein [Candidatus Dojkabacteria bacterium]
MTIPKYALYRFRRFNRNLAKLKSHLAVLFCFGLILGIISNSLLVILLFSVTLIILRFRIISSFFLLTGLLLGTIWIQHSLKLLDDAKVMNEYFENVNLEVVEPPIKNDYSQSIIVKLEGIYGNAIAEIPTSFKLEVGSKILASAQITYHKFQPELKKYEDHLISKKVLYKLEIIEIFSVKNSGTLYSLQSVRRNFITELNNLLPPEHAGLVNGMLFGTNEGISDTSIEILKNTGLTHIISASGFNVMIVYTTIKSVLFLLKRTYRNIISLSVTFLYILLIGVHILPALRAFYMLLLLIIGKELGRKPTVVLLILASASLILLSYPLYYKNISFQLSLIATSCLFIFSENFSLWFDKRNIPEVLSEPLSATLSVLTGTTPVSFFAFGKVSLIAPLSNLILVPLTPIIMYLGVCLLLISRISTNILANLFIFIVKIICSFFFNTATLLSNENLSSTSSSIVVLVFVFIIISILIYIDKKNVSQKFKN